MTDDDKRKQWMDIYTANTAQSDSPSVVDPSASNTQANQPNASQALLQDHFGTGFINYGQFGKGSPETEQYQPSDVTGGSLYDPTKPPEQESLPHQVQRMGDWGQHQQLPGGVNWGQDEPGESPLPFRRMRAALGYRGGEY